MSTTTNESNYADHVQACRETEATRASTYHIRLHNKDGFQRNVTNADGTCRIFTTHRDAQNFVKADTKLAKRHSSEVRICEAMGDYRSECPAH